ncbi:MAG TPA: hemerythrin domain-containing protein [Alphaproteobacteria bacterium]|nr:hemerythrin domain-containing protein [Alphaproteobacteria bacterium]
MPILGRSLSAFAAGAALSFAASRLMPPLAGRAIGMARVAAGGDPFEALARDHRTVLGMMDTLLQSDGQARMRRTAGLMQIKRSLTAHALAEEDVVYPMLREEVGAVEASDRLYREHAEIKIHLFKLEHMRSDDTRWQGEMQALRDLVARHAADEENNEFPRLRERLSHENILQLSGDVSREKQFVL